MVPMMPMMPEYGVQNPVKPNVFDVVQFRVSIQDKTKNALCCRCSARSLAHMEGS